MVTAVLRETKTPKTSRTREREAGASMIEVLVTMVIIAFGLLGMAGLQAQLQVSELEAYQRTQALMLVNDMASRISSNRLNAASYVTGTTYGASMTCPTSTATMAAQDIKEWCEALQGAAEKTGTTRQGSMLGGRGCVQSVGGDYMITVAWQGLTPVSAPPASVTCGANQYDGTSPSKCTSDLCRRAITTLVRIGSLT
jgi:type IV pilus assembly protein PilV